MKMLWILLLLSLTPLKYEVAERVENVKKDIALVEVEKKKKLGQ